MCPGPRSGQAARRAQRPGERPAAHPRDRGTPGRDAQRTPPGSRRRGSGTRTPPTTTTRSRSAPPPAPASHTGADRSGSPGQIPARPTDRPQSNAVPPEPCSTAAGAGRRTGRPVGGPVAGSGGPEPSARCRCGCRSASRSAGRPAGRSALPCRWRATAGSRARRPGRPWPPDRRTSTETTLAGDSALADEPRRVLGPVDDVDLLAVQLGHHGAHPGAHRADAGALGVDPRHRRPDGDLRPVAGLAGDRGDLHGAVGDLRHLQREQPPDQVGMGAATAICGPGSPCVHRHARSTSAAIRARSSHPAPARPGAAPPRPCRGRPSPCRARPATRAAAPPRRPRRPPGRRTPRRSSRSRRRAAAGGSPAWRSWPRSGRSPPACRPTRAPAPVLGQFLRPDRHRAGLAVDLDPGVRLGLLVLVCR